MLLVWFAWLQTLAKVICMVLRFNDEETKAILEREASNNL